MPRLLISFEQDGHSVNYEPPATTGDVYTLCVDILARGWSEAQTVCALAEWCAQWCDGLSSVELIKGYASILPHLAVDMMKHAGMEAEHIAEVKALCDIGSGADDYDANKDDKACGCPRCAGVASASEYCKYNDVTERASVVLDWTHLARNPHFWGLPYSLYQLSRTAEASRIQGDGARRQKRDKERKDRDKAKATRSKHGHRW